MNELLARMAYCGTAPVPEEIWSRWNLDPILIGVLLVLFMWHARQTRTTNPRWSQFPLPAATRRTALYAGWTALALGLISPICALSVSLFSARVTQHMWLTVVAAPLIALGGIGAPAAARSSRMMTPFTAAGLFAISLWWWHWPSMYARTFTSDIAYWAMHVSMIGTALLLWCALLAPSHESALARVIAAFGTLTQMGLLGALIVFAPRALYSPHFLTAPAWNLSALEDQQLGGLIMWIPAGVAFLIIARIAAHSVLRESEHGALGGRNSFRPDVSGSD